MTCAGGEDAGSGRRDVCNAVAALSVVRRLQLVRQSALREPLADAVLSSGRLRQQRRQPDPLQRHVRQVPQRVPRSARLLLLLSLSYVHTHTHTHTLEQNSEHSETVNLHRGIYIKLY